MFGALPAEERNYAFLNLPYSTRNKLPGIWLTTREGVRAEIGRLKAVFFGICIADEAHFLRNYTTETSRALAQLQVGIWWLLSGTPYMLRYSDLYPQLFFLNAADFTKDDKLSAVADLHNYMLSELYANPRDGSQDNCIDVSR